MKLSGDLLEEYKQKGWNPYVKSLHEWLRDVKHIHVNISPYSKDVPNSNLNILWEYEIISLQDLELLSMQDGFSSHENALNQSLVKIITLI